MSKIIAVNKKAFHEYSIVERLEAGIVLTGFEVKALRSRGGSLTDSFVRISKNFEAKLINVYIPPYQGGKQGYDGRAERKLLLHKKEIGQLYGRLVEGNYTIIPLKMYMRHNFVKVELGLAKRKKQFEKREAIKRKDMLRAVERELRGEKDR